MYLPLDIENELKNHSFSWLVTGVAGFIGSHIAEQLLNLGQIVRGLDNFETGSAKNLIFLAHEKFTFIQGDIRDEQACINACVDIDFVLHQAAIGSVPKSYNDPVYVDSINVNGFANILKASGETNVRRFVYASSSAVYGDSGHELNSEDQDLYPKSPYAIGKQTNELYAQSLGEFYGLDTAGLRYFNIYGPRQDPNGAYAAVIAKWCHQIQEGLNPTLFGDGSAVRDFCYIHDAVQANILAALSESSKSHDVYNIASGDSVNLKQLHETLEKATNQKITLNKKDERVGDIKLSQADISKAKEQLGFKPIIKLEEGLNHILNPLKSEHHAAKA